MQVAECKFLNNRLVALVAFLENIAVKDAFDKARLILLPGYIGSGRWHGSKQTRTTLIRDGIELLCGQQTPG